MSATKHKHKETRQKAGAQAPCAQSEGKHGGAGGDGASGEGCSVEARRRAAVILEVLAGQLRPSEAAAAAGISITRYYMLEQKALAGLVAACEVRPAGRSKTPQARLEELEKRHARLEQECARYQAIARAAQRSLGLSLPAGTQGPERRGPKGRRLKGPSVRALRFSERLKADLPRQDAGAQAAPAGNT